jgi:hypothetical protein
MERGGIMRIDGFTYPKLFEKELLLCLEVSYEVNGDFVLINFQTIEGQLIFQISGQNIGSSFDEYDLGYLISELSYFGSIKIALSDTCFYSNVKGAEFVINRLNLGGDLIPELKKNYGIE